MFEKIKNKLKSKDNLKSVIISSSIFVFIVSLIFIIGVIKSPFIYLIYIISLIYIILLDTKENSKDLDSLRFVSATVFLSFGVGFLASFVKNPVNHLIIFLLGVIVVYILY